MTLLALAIALAVSAEPADGAARSVTVKPNESLKAVARRALGDEEAASEIAALNGLSPGAAVTAGTSLKLPGADRFMAQSAVSAAKSAIQQADAKSPKRADAEKRLQEAMQHFAQARYAESARAADEAWQLASQKGNQPTQFRVEVGATGRTEVTTKNGRAVHVEAQGVTQPVYSGHAVAVEKGKPPGRPAEALPPPTLVSPEAQAKVALKPQKSGLGPLTLIWTPVPGAKGYDVEVVGAQGAILLTVQRSEATLTELAQGSYSWTVRTVGGAVRSQPSSKWSFDVSPDPLKLDVRKTGWK